MFCSKCGVENRDGSKFCSVCGAPFKEPATQPAVQYAPPANLPENRYNVRYGSQQDGMPVSPKKKKTGLVIGLIAGILVLLGGAAALYFFVFAGTGVNGYWYSDETSIAFEFKDNGKAVQYGLMGKEEAGYEYDRQKGEGVLDLGDAKYDFTADKDTLTFSEKGVKSEFKRADKDFDAGDFFFGRLKGLYSNKTNAEVLELKEGKSVISHSFSGDAKGTYVFDFDRGRGTLTFNGKDVKFSASVTDISLDTYGTYIKEEKSFNTNGFLYECLSGCYFNKDIPEVLEMKSGKAVISHMAGSDSIGTFDYDLSKGAGTIKMGSKDFTIAISSGTMNVSGVGAYIRQTDDFDYVAALNQGGSQKIVTIVGKWYDKAGHMGTFTFSGDGTIEFYFAPKDTGFKGVYTFDTVSENGTVTIDFAGSKQTYNFVLSDGVLNLNNGEAYFTTDSVAQNK